jgi:BAAT / Acyl-CoA thioester hydrolase C terminal
MPNATIPIEKARARVILVAGGDDALWPLDFFARTLADRLMATGKQALQVWVLQIREKIFCGGSRRIGFEDREGKVYRNQIAADRVIQLLPRRLRRPPGIGGTAPAEIRISQQAVRQNR